MTTSDEPVPRKVGAIWLLDLNEPATAVIPRIQVTFQWMNPEPVQMLAEAMGPGSSAEIDKRFTAGCMCYAARVDNRLAAYGWVSFQEEYVGELNLWIRLQPGEAYIWDCATLPAFRNLHLYSALLSNMSGELRSQSIERIWIGADLVNLPSQRGIARAGFRAIAEIAVARALGMRRVWIMGRPDIPEDLVAEARRVFLNNREKVWLAAIEEVNHSQ